MTHSEFIQLVMDMRDAQKDYFRNRADKKVRSSLLQRAMKLEAEVCHATYHIDRNCNHQTKPHANTTPIHHTPSGE